MLSWSILFWHTFQSLLSFPATAVVSISPAIYIKALAHGVKNFFFVTEYRFLSGAAVLALWYAARNKSWDNIYFYGLLATFIHIVSKVILYPNIEQRYYTADFLIVLYCALSLFAGRLGAISPLRTPLVRDVKAG